MDRAQPTPSTSSYTAHTHNNTESHTTYIHWPTKIHTRPWMSRPGYPELSEECSSLKASGAKQQQLPSLSPGLGGLCARDQTRCELLPLGVRRDRQTGGSELITLILHSVLQGAWWWHTPWRWHRVSSGSWGRPRGVPRWPSSMCIFPRCHPAPGTMPMALTLFWRNEVLGDFNAHHHSWFSRIGDDRAAARVEAIDGAINSSQFAVENQDLPNRLPFQGQLSSSDITLLSGNLLPDAMWSTLTTLGSDHLHITVSLSSNAPPSPRKARSNTNFRKADWEEFTAE